MIAQDKITSGFDIEMLMGEDYIKYLLLTSMETGTLPWFSISKTKDSFGNVIKTDHTFTHPPEELNEKRLYPVHPDFVGNEHPFLDLVTTVYSEQEDEFNVTILTDNELGANIRVKVYPSIITDTNNPAKIKKQIENVLSMNLDIKLGLSHDTPSEDGLIRNIKLKVELLDINGDLINAAASFHDENGDPVFSKEDTLAQMKEQIDREAPFSMAGNGALQGIDIKIFPAEDETPAAIGVYINLVLQKGPDKTDLFEQRGSVDDAQNFLPKDSKMAFGIPQASFSKLAKNLFQQMAVLKENSTTEYHYPLMDGDEEIGTIKGVSIYAETKQVNNGPIQFTNVLIIDIHGEYALNNLPDPDFNLRIRLIPSNKNGLMEFDVDVDLSLSPLAKLIVLLLEIALTIAMPYLGATLLLFTVAAIPIAEYVFAKKAADKADGQLDNSSFLDALPHKLVIERRRWDPLYTTLHQLEIKADNIAVNNLGFAFSGGDIFVGRRFEPLDNTVIRSEVRDTVNHITGLQYRVADYNNFINNDFQFIFPAVDRLPFTAVLPPQGFESFRIHLTNDQIQERVDAKNKLLKSIPYQPKRIDLQDGQIFKIMAASDLELSEIKNTARSLLRNELTAQNGAAYRTKAITELTAELGRSPDETEIKDRVKIFVDADIAVALPARLEKELDLRMTFDLQPSEFAQLQKKELLVFGKEQLEIIEMKRDDGSHTIYYRDIRYHPSPEPQPSDNLLALPRYKS